MTGSCNDVLGSASRGFGVKRREELWSACFQLNVQRRRSVSVGGFESAQHSLSLGSSALHVQGRPQWKQTGLLVSRSPHICFSWFRWEFLNRSSVFLVTAAYVGRGLFSVGFVDTV
ncbi:hypothetical protein TNCV_1136091 [Trichonephila clavipes]|nr:hypothetical protein TNCV_1136091 [Trichonephila clavipes]